MQKVAQIYYRTLTALVMILVYSSCSSAYYNTFYNAEKLFKEGEQEYFNRSSSTSFNKNAKIAKIDKLEKSIQKCAKVLAYYGDGTENEYADDAYFIIAKSSYYLLNYTNVLEAVSALESKHPNSVFLKEARFLKAKSLVESGQINAGKDVLLKINTINKIDTMNIELIYAEMDFYENKTDSGIHRLVNAIKLITPEKNEQETALLNQIYIKLKAKINETQDFSHYLLFEKILFNIRSIVIKKELFVNMLYYAMLNHNKEMLSYLRDNIDEGQFIDSSSPLKKHLDVCLRLGIYNEINFDDFIIEKTETNSRDKSKDGFQNYIYFYKSYYYDFVENNADSVDIYLKKTNRINHLIIKDYVTNRSRFLLNIANINKTKYIFSDNDSINIIDPEYHYKLGEFYFNEKMNNMSLISFSEYRILSNDSSKIALSFLYSAFILEKINKLKSDSLYQLVYDNFKEYKSNDDLLRKIGKEIKIVKDLRYEKLVDQFDINNLSYEQFIKVKNSVFANDSNIILNNDKIAYLEIYILIKESNFKTAISKIEKFKKTYPNSIFIKELNMYDIKQSNSSENSETKKEIVTNENNSKKHKSDKTEIKPKTPGLEFKVAPKKFYPGEKIQFILEVTINPKGEIINFITEDKLDPLVRKKLNEIITKIKYKSFDDEENKNDFITITFGSLNDFNQKEKGRKLLDD